MTEDEMVGWHHRLNGHKFEQALGDCEGQGSLECCSPWGHKESDMTERLNNDCIIRFSRKLEYIYICIYMYINADIHHSPSPSAIISLLSVCLSSHLDSF